MNRVVGNVSRRNFIRTTLISGVGLYAGIKISAPAVAAGSTTELILLGTQGGPNFKLARSESASVVRIDGRPYLVDCGYGTMRALTAAGVPYLDVAHIFLTHLHDDHVADIAALLGHQWTQGRVEPTLVYGPYGTDALVAAALQYNRANTEIRMLDEGRSVRPEDLFSGQVVPATSQPYTVYQDERLVVHAVENTHFPEDFRQQSPYHSLSYRFQSDSRSIVFSGDTGYSDNLVRLAKNADVLVCEAMHVAATRQTFENMVAEGMYADNPDGIWKHIVETHTSTEDAGRMANAAGVKLLVLNHIIPGALQDLPDAMYLEGVRKHYRGEVIIGSDLLRI